MTWTYFCVGLVIGGVVGWMLCAVMFRNRLNSFYKGPEEPYPRQLCGVDAEPVTDKPCIMTYAEGTTLHVDIPSNWEVKRERLLDAIAMVESNNDNEAVGDCDEYGAYQITLAYMQDAVEQDPELLSERPDTKWELSPQENWRHALRSPAFSRKVIAAYMQRWCPRSWAGPGDEGLEVIARTHNGGPDGSRKDSTLPYWRKVQKAMEKLEVKQ